MRLKLGGRVRMGAHGDFTYTLADGPWTDDPSGATLWLLRRESDGSLRLEPEGFLKPVYPQVGETWQVKSPSAPWTVRVEHVTEDAVYGVLFAGHGESGRPEGWPLDAFLANYDRGEQK